MVGTAGVAFRVVGAGVIARAGPAVGRLGRESACKGLEGIGAPI